MDAAQNKIKLHKITTKNNENTYQFSFLTVKNIKKNALENYG